MRQIDPDAEFRASLTRCGLIAQLLDPAFRSPAFNRKARERAWHTGLRFAEAVEAEIAELLAIEAEVQRDLLEYMVIVRLPEPERSAAAVAWMERHARPSS